VGLLWLGTLAEAKQSPQLDCADIESLLISYVDNTCGRRGLNVAL
jgi:hypothetical protein